MILLPCLLKKPASTRILGTGDGGWPQGGLQPSPSFALEGDAATPDQRHRSLHDQDH